MKKVKVVMYVEVGTMDEPDADDIIKAWLENSIDGLTHEVFDLNDTKLGEIDVKVVEVEVTDA